jgi:FAD:protein FMN transferase
VRFNGVRPRLSKTSWHRSSIEPVLGTQFTLQILGRSQRAAETIATQLQKEIERLENIFSVYRPQSTLSIWKNADSLRTLTKAEAPELTEVLALAETWRQRTGGCFTPLADEFSKRWRVAEANQIVPSGDELERLTLSLQEPRYFVEAATGDIRTIGDCSSLSLHAIAKGWIVDRAAELAMQDERVRAVLVNIGGDLRLCGTDTSAASTVAIENPLRAYDNEPPLCRIRLTAGGLATSGGSRRGFTIDGHWYSHVIDPRTGCPVNQVASASVFAPDATTADAIATMLSVVEPIEGMAFVKDLMADGTFPPQSLGCLIVDPHGQQFSNDVWDALTLQPAAS